jgi:ATP-binding cassette subfamily B protein
LINLVGVTETAQQPFLSAWKDRLQALKNIPPVLRIVWDSGPSVVVLGLLFRAAVSLVPVSTAWVTKLIIDLINAVVQHKATLSNQLWWLAGAEFSLAVLGSLLGRVVDYYDAVLADRYSRHVSIEVMRHAYRPQTAWG